MDQAVWLTEHPEIQEALRSAWTESQHGTVEVHEEGGFVVQDSDGEIRIERWPRGDRNEIEVPDHAGGDYLGARIVATFHTHPNPAPEFQQEPSLSDIRAVRFDRDLRHAQYRGEFIISASLIYFIQPDGSVVELGDTRRLLNLA